MKRLFPRYRIYKLRELLAIVSFDIATHILLAPLKIFHLYIRKQLRDYSKDKIRKILIFRTDRIGDLVMTLPAIKLLRERYPEAKLHLVTGRWNEPILNYVKYFDLIHFWSPSWISRGEESDSFLRLCLRVIKIRKEQYDLSIDFTSDVRINLLMWLSGAKRRIGYSDSGGGAYLTETVEDRGIHRVEQNMEPLKTLGIAEKDYVPKLEGTIQFESGIGKTLGDFDGKNINGNITQYIIIHPWGGRPVKTWRMEKYAGLAKIIREKFKIDIILTGSRQDNGLCESIKEKRGIGVLNLAGKFTFEQMMSAMKSALVFISPDTGPMHIAVALGVPTVTLFGPSDPAKYGPYGDRKLHRVIVSKDISCLHCNKIRKPPGRCFKDGISICMDAISVEDVFKECMALLDSLE
jgi:ADP-heptose:LPS heptosyltransferase